jgi:hypothetical protein
MKKVSVFSHFPPFPQLGDVDNYVEKSFGGWKLWITQKTPINQNVL